MTERRDRLMDPEHRLTVRGRAYLLLGAPLCLVLLAVELARVWRALRGDPLLIFGLSDPDVTVRWSASPVYFVGGLVMHGVIILFLTLMLASLYPLTRRWRRGPRP